MTEATLTRDAAGAGEARDLGTVVLVDAGVGNLGNVRRALAHLGAVVETTTDSDVVAAARRLVLPGVGAFRPPRERLRGELEEAISSALDDGAWLFGICVGYQLLFASSTEFGATDGLGLLPGEVEQLPSSAGLPHIGWNRLRRVADHPLFAGVEDGTAVYFVHSFAPVGVPEEACIAESTHGRPFPAAVAVGRVAGVQFHPEKSGPAGLAILRNFLETSRGALPGD